MSLLAHVDRFVLMDEVSPVDSCGVEALRDRRRPPLACSNAAHQAGGSAPAFYASGIDMPQSQALGAKTEIRADARLELASA